TRARRCFRTGRANSADPAMYASMRESLLPINPGAPDPFRGNLSGRLLRRPLRCGLGACFRGHILDMGGNAPLVTEGINELAHAITPEHIGGRHDALGSAGNGSLIHLINAGYVKEHARTRAGALELGRERAHLRAFVAEHQDVVAYFQLSMRD